jgi:hypothetical protein
LRQSTRVIVDDDGDAVDHREISIDEHADSKFLLRHEDPLLPFIILPQGGECVMEYRQNVGDFEKKDALRSRVM